MKESRYVEYVRKYLNSRARKWKRAQVTGVGTTKEFAYQDARQNARETYGQAFRVRSKKFAKSVKRYQCILNIEYYSTD